jgi:PPP family 3-phenylpropionic acid transporter
LKIVKPLLFAKGFYFLYYAANASLGPFLSIYYQSLGFQGSQIGLLLSISPFVMLLSTPIWGAAADIYQRHKLSLMIAIGGALMMVGLLSQLRHFALIVTVVLMFSFFSAPIIPLVDNSVMALLGERRDLYGRQGCGSCRLGDICTVIGTLLDKEGLQLVLWLYDMAWIGFPGGF